MDQNFFKYNNPQNLEELQSQNFFLNRLEPENLCPFAAHALYPYYHSFSRGSWFRWMKDKNCVFAQCPNPSVCLTFKITRNKLGNIAAEVVAKKGDCRANHFVGQIFRLAKAEGELPKYDYCRLNDSSKTSVSVVKHSRACRYYKKIGTTVAPKNYIPDGFCQPAYFKAYPDSLSLLYDGCNFKKEGRENYTEIVCPNAGKNVKIKIRTKRHIFAPLMNLADKILRLINMPREALDKNIEYDLVEVNGNCKINLKPGQKFKFNLYRRAELCPAVFYTLFPFRIMLRKEIFPYWSCDFKHIDIHCPDSNAEIVHRISINNN